MFSKTLLSLFLSAFPYSTALAHPSTCPLPLSSILDYACPSPPEPYIVKPSPGKGLGVFASHSLETGSIIMREAPILRISPPDSTQGSGYPLSEVTKLVRQEFERLSPAEQSEVLGLTYHTQPGEKEKEDKDEVLGLIFRTNAYNTGSSIGLFPKIARINHSCRPNAAYYWSEKLNRRIIYASRPILRGEEISVSYIPLLLPRAERQQRLHRYGFTCSCSACDQQPRSVALSDTRRTDIHHAFQAFQPHLSLSLPRKTASSLRKARKNAASSLQLAELVEQEGLADYYAKAYRIVAISHARVEDWERATMWANKGFERKVMEDAGSAGTMEMFELTRRFVESWEEQLKNATRGQ
ncbi:SET domain-containing protein [Trematosphaeria pertusa]|uniref:SET domain-containing protein n=1 Tax=Trematosphaeria pertusa TaxID=390896 RepID=A0A6A6IEV7_9PLEO|nr:SET domain-containing protein [Trematosphaeria pertusa]KAF2249114.1 SET domain-containing protein [Trematosphaeria pertusa]